MIETIQVAVGVVVNSAGEFLVAQRPEGKPFAGCWEFPGGKVEQGESILEALIRELEEEINLTPTRFEPFMMIEQIVSNKCFLLDTWLVSAYSGTPNANEGQVLKWVSLTELKNLTFPPANHQIIEKLCVI
ncbi:MAG: 8-oxo-dGTP diphosphatase MutT [Legionellales bacterium]|nr:8-oxo-dGTP diphosphatase MutT [Legionellales bacterium]